ncbi:SprB repeat-containing protein, partial [Flavobacterium sp. LC2016-01]|uniref:SprB repeat-containing protein n=1 Tax=Flavobacterium sp. LC2016-01 TaxID=2675876 RepID=UPI001325E063
CKTTCTVLITQPDVLSCSVVQNDPAKCYGDSNGKATVTPVGGNGDYTYAWDNGETTAQATALNAGTHTVTVTDKLGYKTTCTVIIGQPEAALTCSVVQNKAVTANGLSNGEATVTPLGGNGGYTYAWDNGETVAHAITLNAGTHTVTVTDSKGCKTTCTVLITQPDVLSCSVVQNDPAKCYGDSNGKATVTPIGGNGEYTYLWDNGETTAQATGLNAGNHTVTVTDKLGYKTTCTVVIGQPQSALTCSVIQNKAVTANGLSNGEATVTPLGGNGGYAYAWDNGETTQKAVGLNAGLHTVTVTDSKGCKTTCTVTITEPNVLSCSITQDDPAKCYGDSNGKATVVAIGGNGEYTYLWDNGEITAQATGLNAGTHTVTVTDKLGYKTTCSVVIGQPQSALTCSVIQNKAVTANGLSNGEATVTPLGGNGGYTYAWDNGETVAHAITLNAGTHTVTVTDSKGCKTTCTVLITQPDVLSCSVVQNDPAKCYGDSNGKATVTPVGGNGDYTYAWDNGETTAQATGLNAGTHTVTVTDKLGYKTTCTVVIGQPQSALTCSVIQNKAVTANGLSNGEATVTPLGGNGGYTYLWDNGETTQKAVGLNAGLHSVTVTDSKGCKTTCTVTITEPNVLSCSITQDDPAKCYGDSNGKATVVAIGGNGEYTYLWDNGETTAQATGLNAGTHTVTVTDKLGYKTTCTVVIGQPSAPLTATKSQINPGCGGAATGSATVVASGGTAPYTYSWNTNPVQTTATASNLAAGSYTVIITDAKGCTHSESFEIIDGDSILPVIDPLPATSTINCPAEPVFAQATASDLNGTISSLTYVDNVTPGNCAGSYTKTRTWTAKDACGNVSLPVSQTIIVQDITAPTWTTQTASLNKTIECSNAQALASAQALFPTATDACDTDVSNIVKVSGQFIASEGCSNAGTYTNTWTVKDACG